MTNPWMLGPNCLSFIFRLLPGDSTILELGSGEGSGVLCEQFNLFSVEHDSRWLGRYDSTYIFAPLGPDGWYCLDMLRGKLPTRYDLFLIDGPPGEARPLLLLHLNLFKLDCPIIIDDINRERDLIMARALAEMLKRPLLVFDEPDGRQFGYIGEL